MTVPSSQGRPSGRRVSVPRPYAGPLLALLPGLFATAASAQVDGAATLAPVTVRSEAAGPTGRLALDTPAETGSRLGLTPRQTPAAVTVVDRATVDARGARNTQEILRAIPGITAHDAPGNVGVSYRGFSGASLSQLFNGIHVQYTIAARPVDSWIYDRVEAIGGASGFLYGAGAVGGTINAITKLPEPVDFAEAELRLGSYGETSAAVGLNRRIAGDGGAGSQTVRIDLHRREGGAWTEGTRPRATQLAASLLSDLGGGVRHTLAYEFQDEQVRRPYWGTPVLDPAAGRLRIDPGIRDRNYNAADGLYAQRVQWLRSIAEWRLNDALQLKNTVYAYDALRDYRNVETYRYTAANTDIVRSGTLLQRHDQDLLGNRLEAVYRGRLAGLPSDWAGGIDLSRNRQTRFPNSLAVPVNTVNPYAFVPEPFFSIAGTSPVYQADRDNRIGTVAVYLENRTALLPVLHLVSGLRHERIDLDLTNRRAVTAAAPATLGRRYTPTTGRVGIVWDVTPDANLYAQYATAADPPSGILSTASFADVANNTALTTGRQIEVGSKLDFWDKRGTATLAAYRIVRSNLATQDPANTAVTVLVGEQSSRGVELAVGLQATPDWSVQGNLAWVDARYDRFVQGGTVLDGRTPTNTPARVANLWTSLRIAPQWTAIAGVRHVGQVYADAANTLTWPGYTLLDLGLQVQLGRNLSVVGRIRNATDRLYAANALATQVYLGPPRSADIALRATF